MTIRDFCEEIVKQVDVDERWRRSSHASYVDRQNSFMCILPRVICLTDPLQVKISLKGGFGEFVERHVCQVSCGMNEPDALQVPPISVIQPVVKILWQFH